VPIFTSLVATVKMKAVRKFYAFPVFLFYDVITLMKVIHVLNVYYHTQFQLTALSDIVVTPTAQDSMAALLILLMVGN
jgi:hypothetical protein